MNALGHRIQSSARELITRAKSFCLWLTPEARLRFGVIAPGVAYRCAQPNERQFRYLIEAYHPRMIVVIRKRVYAWERTTANECGVFILHIPLTKQNPTDEVVNVFLRHVRDPRYQPFIIHCLRGKDRTGLFALIFRIEVCGWNLQNALTEMISCGHAAFTGQSSYKDWLQKRYPEAHVRSPAPNIRR